MKLEILNSCLNPLRTQVLIDGQRLDKVRRVTIEIPADGLIEVTIVRYLGQGDRISIGQEADSNNPITLAGDFRTHLLDEQVMEAEVIDLSGVVDEPD